MYVWKKTNELAAVHERTGEKVTIEVHRHMIPARYGRQTWLHKGTPVFSSATARLSSSWTISVFVSNEATFCSSCFDTPMC